MVPAADLQEYFWQSLPRFPRQLDSGELKEDGAACSAEETCFERIDFKVLLVMDSSHQETCCHLSYESLVTTQM